VYNQLKYNYLPPNTKNIHIKNNSVQFTNGITPEMVHGVNCRDMTVLLDPELKFEHPRRQLPDFVSYMLTTLELLLPVSLIVTIYYAYNYM
jgi:hypothetical protein